MANNPVNRSEAVHYSVFMIGLIVMLGGVAMIANYEDAALFSIVTGGAVAVLAMISQAYSWYKNGDL